jgi:hypothetical protein
LTGARSVVTSAAMTLAVRIAWWKTVGSPRVATFSDHHSTFG